MSKANISASNKLTSGQPGKVYLVGAGPGAVDLITVRGAKLLAQSDIVFYDALVDPEMLSLCPQAERVAVVTLAQGTEILTPGQPIGNPTADTLVYYMGRKDATRIAKQLIEIGQNHTVDTPVHILEAVSTPKERHWSSNLGELAQGKADNWFDSSSPALIMIGQALREKSECLSSEIDNGLQDTIILSNSQGRA